MTTRRAFLRNAGLTALTGTLRPSSLKAAPSAPPDYRLAIASHSLEVARNKFLKTIAYNNQVPGPALRLRHGRPVSIEVTNRTSHPEIVHWHGLSLPPVTDGAMEEGAPMIAPGAEATLRFTPQQSGLRWYHTHTSAGGNLSLGQYSGQHGLLLIESDETPTPYTQQVTLVLHDWDGQFAGSDDGTMEPAYRYSTINGRTESFNEPIRAQPGSNILFQVLNSSATDVHWLTFSGHQFQVLALDGNPLHTPRTVPMLRLAPAERVTALVTMNSPGVWVLAEPRRHIRAAGMGIVVEYAGASGSPVFLQPETLTWSYADFAQQPPQENTQPPPTVLPIVIQSRFRGHGAPEQWLLNGFPYPQPTVPVLRTGTVYRLRFDNRSMDPHPMHLHRHLFRLVSIAGKRMYGPLKDTVLVDPGTIVEVDFTADNPGPSLLHCHQQDHMDRGFMMVLQYA